MNKIQNLGFKPFEPQVNQDIDNTQLAPASLEGRLFRELARDFLTNPFLTHLPVDEVTLIDKGQKKAIAKRMQPEQTTSVVVETYTDKGIARTIQNIYNDLRSAGLDVPQVKQINRNSISLPTSSRSLKEEIYLLGADPRNHSYLLSEINNMINDLPAISSELTKQPKRRLQRMQNNYVKKIEKKMQLDRSNNRPIEQLRFLEYIPFADKQLVDSLSPLLERISSTVKDFPSRTADVHIGNYYPKPAQRYEGEGSKKDFDFVIKESYAQGIAYMTHSFMPVAQQGVTILSDAVSGPESFEHVSFDKPYALQFLDLKPNSSQEINQEQARVQNNIKKFSKAVQELSSELADSGREHYQSDKAREVSTFTANPSAWSRSALIDGASILLSLHETYAGKEKYTIINRTINKTLSQIRHNHKTLYECAQGQKVQTPPYSFVEDFPHDSNQTVETRDSLTTKASKAVGEGKGIEEAVYLRVATELTRMAGKKLDKLSKEHDAYKIMDHFLEFQYSLTVGLQALERSGEGTYVQDIQDHFMKGLHSAISTDKLTSAYELIYQQQDDPQVLKTYKQEKISKEKLLTSISFS